MNHMVTARELADLVIAMTDLGTTKQQKELIEINARSKAKSYLKNLEVHK